MTHWQPYVTESWEELEEQIKDVAEVWADDAEGVDVSHEQISEWLEA